MNSLRSIRDAVALAGLSLATGCIAQSNTSTNESADEIVNGKAESGYAAAGYLRSHAFSAGEKRGFDCSATLIAPNVVLTAAHCVQGASVDSFVFGLGPFDKPTAEFTASAVFSHPSYMRTGELADTFRHDIAVVLLSRAASVAPATLAPAKVGKGYVAVGYGQGAAGDYDPAMKTSTVRRSGAFEVTALDTLHLIAKGTATGACYGDSGGPLFREGTREIVGVTSGMAELPVECGTDKRTAFTNVDTHSGFIRDAMKCKDKYITSVALPADCLKETVDDPAMAGDASKKWEILGGPNSLLHVVAVSPVDDTVYTLEWGHGPRIEARDPKTGAVRFTVSGVDVERLPVADEGQFLFGKGGGVYWTSGHKVQALGSNGTILWEKSIHLVRIAPDDTIMGVDESTKPATIVAVRPDGTTKWSAPFSGGTVVNLLPLRDGAIAIASWGKGLQGSPNQLSVLGNTGKAGATVTLDHRVDSGLLELPDAMLAYGSTDGDCSSAFLVVIDRAGGTRWKTSARTINRDNDAGCHPVHAPILGASGQIYFHGGGLLRAVDGTGKAKWEQLWKSSLGPPVVDRRENIIVVSPHGRVYAADKTGTPIWKYVSSTDSGRPFSTGPGAGSDGSIYFGRTENLMAILPP